MTKLSDELHLGKKAIYAQLQRAERKGLYVQTSAEPGKLRTGVMTPNCKGYGDQRTLRRSGAHPPRHR